jgi:hypothetical protein
MTIEVAMQGQSAESRIVLGWIRPGEIATFSDFTNNERRVVSVQCRADDDGGEVYAFDDPGYVQSDTVRVVPADAYASHAPEAVIAKGDTYKRDVTMESRRIAHMIFTHLAPDAL